MGVLLTFPSDIVASVASGTVRSRSEEPSPS